MIGGAHVSGVQNPDRPCPPELAFAASFRAQAKT